MAAVHTPLGYNCTVPRMTRRFIRHYFEMVVAMLLGMLVLGGAATVLLEAIGIDVSSWDHDLPALFLFAIVLAPLWR